MRIPLKMDSKRVKQRLHRLDLIYKQKVEVEIDRMLEAEIIEPDTKLESISSMVIQDEKMGGIKICVDPRKLNDGFLHDSFPTPFTDEFLENVGGH